MTAPGSVFDASRIDATATAFASGDATVTGYLARPRTDGRRPGIVVIHEAFGLGDHIRDVARRLANVGFDALAPNLYERCGTPDASDIRSVMSTMLAVPDRQVVDDLEAAVRYLGSLDRSSGVVGALGFCSGGRQALLLACSGSVLAGAVSCWGGFIDRASPDAVSTATRPTPVLDLVENLSCPLLAVGGVEDQNPSPAVLGELERRLAGVTHDSAVEIFDGAGHAFFADHRPENYRDEPAHQLWPKIISFFETNLNGGER